MTTNGNESHLNNGSVRNEKGQFVKGHPGNPDAIGRPKNGASISTFMNKKLDEIPTEIMGKRYTGTKTWAEMIAEANLISAAFGVHAHLGTLLDRTEGKVPDNVNIKGEVQYLERLEDKIKEHIDNNP